MQVLSDPGSAHGARHCVRNPEHRLVAGPTELDAEGLRDGPFAPQGVDHPKVMAVEGLIACLNAHMGHTLAVQFEVKPFHAEPPSSLKPAPVNWRPHDDGVK